MAWPSSGYEARHLLHSLPLTLTIAITHSHNRNHSMAVVYEYGHRDNRLLDNGCCRKTAIRLLGYASLTHALRKPALIMMACALDRWSVLMIVPLMSRAVGRCLLGHWQCHGAHHHQVHWYRCWHASLVGMCRSIALLLHSMLAAVVIVIVIVIVQLCRLGTCWSDG
jgi:hypothetical protein